MTDELRQFLRKRCDESLFFFLKLVLGFKDLVPALHGQFSKYVQTPGRFKLIVGPRGHLKTSICTIGYAFWRAAKDPNIRVLITANTATNASHMVRTIKQTVESSDMVKWLYPEIIPDSGCKWTDTEIEFKRTATWPESTIESLGRGGTVTSRHYDLIIEDDLLSPEENQEITPELVQTAVKWHKYASGLRMSYESEQVISANRWMYDDYVAYLMENEKWFLPCMYMSAYNSAGTPRWSERFPADELDRLLEQQGPRIFSAQYLNDPVHEDARSFDTSWFRYYTVWPPRNGKDEVQGFKCVTAIDPAISQKKHGDYSAIVTVAADTNRNRYVVDARRGRWGVDELIDHVFEVYRTWKPVKVGLETIMFQKALMWPFREAMRREEQNLPMVELRPSSKVTKDGRIMALHEFFQNGSTWLNKQHTELLSELRGWPAITHDDMLDALAYAMQMLVYPTEEKSYTYWNPLSFEHIQRELNARRNMAGTGAFLWPLTGRPANVLANSGRLPQSEEEVWDLIQEVRRDNL